MTTTHRNITTKSHTGGSAIKINIFGNTRIMEVIDASLLRIKKYKYFIPSHFLSPQPSDSSMSPFSASDGRNPCIGRVLGRASSRGSSTLPSQSHGTGKADGGHPCAPSSRPTTTDDPALARATQTYPAPGDAVASWPGHGRRDRDHDGRGGRAGARGPPIRPCPAGVAAV